MNPPAICFGEVLWDRLPSGSVAGGAPMNVAIRLSSLGVPSCVISSVGDDAEGDRLLAMLKSRNVGTQLIQSHPAYPTGAVNVFVSADGTATYDIIAPSAWDAIDYSDASCSAVRTSRAFIFGSLACRYETSRTTLFRLLEEASWSIFDVNLRPPFAPLTLIDDLMQRADVIKMNDEELRRISAGTPAPDERTMIEHLADRTGAGIICVTRGKNGAAVLSQGEYFEHPGFSVPVKDTVGSGDSFLAGFIWSLMEGKGTTEALKFSCALGALVAMNEGANPEISKDAILRLAEGSTV